MYSTFDLVELGFFGHRTLISCLLRPWQCLIHPFHKPTSLTARYFKFRWYHDLISPQPSKYTGVLFFFFIYTVNPEITTNLPPRLWKERKKIVGVFFALAFFLSRSIYSLRGIRRKVFFSIKHDLQSLLTNYTWVLCQRRGYVFYPSESSVPEFL